jgi:hypothetical protein
MLHPAVLLTALTLAGAPEADEPFRIAVPAMRLSGVGEDLGRILTEIVTTETSSLPNAKVIGASDITTMLGFEQEKQLLGCEDNVSCIAEIGGALGVELLLVSDLGLVGETYVLNLKLIDTESVLVKKRVYKTVSGKADDLIEAVRKALRELLAVVAPDAVAAVEEPVTWSLRTPWPRSKSRSSPNRRRRPSHRPTSRRRSTGTARACGCVGPRSALVALCWDWPALSS